MAARRDKTPTVASTAVADVASHCRRLPEHDGERAASRDGARNPADKEPAAKDLGDKSTCARSYRPLLVVFLAVALGVVLDRLLGLAWGVWLWSWCGGLVLWWLGCRLGALRRWSAVGVLIAAAAAGGAWHHAQWRFFGADDLGLAASAAPRPISVELVALSRPRVLPPPPEDPFRVMPATESSRLLARAVSVRSGRQWRSASGRVRLSCPGRLPALRAGDRLRVFGWLSACESPGNPGQPDFAAYARGERRLCRLRAPFPAAVQVVQPRFHAISPRDTIQALRQHGRETLYRYVRPAQAAMAAALLLGFREELGTENQRRFLVTGTMHLLAISGLHVGVLAAGVWWLCQVARLPRRTVLAIIMAFVLGYAVLTELRPSVVRASLLIVGWCAGRLLERRCETLNMLSAAALVVLVLQPAALFQTGAQLSFLAVATLVCLEPPVPRDRPADPLHQLLQRTRPWPWRWCRRAAGGLLRIAATGAAVWLVTLPLVLLRFHVASFIGLPLNVVLAAPLTIALFFGLLTVLLGPLWPPLAMVAGTVCDVSLTVMQGCIESVERLGGGHVWLPGPPGWFVTLYYGGWAAVVVVPRLRARRRLVWLLLGLAGALSIVLTPALRHLRYAAARQPLTVTVVDVGHGTSVLCEFPDGSTWLYDAGSLAPPDISVEAISACLWSRGIWRLDRVVLSHADADHYNALPGLVPRFRVAAVDVGPRMFDRPPPAIAALRRALREAGIPVGVRASGELRAVGDSVRVEVLHPPAAGVSGNDNANSLVLRISCRGQHLLLPGDLEHAGLERLLALPPLPCQVVLAPHHGSEHSRPADVCRWADPRYVIVSGGGQRDGQALEPYRVRGIRVLETARRGAVQIRWRDHGVRVRGWRNPEPRGDPTEATGKEDGVGWRSSRVRAGPPSSVDRNAPEIVFRDRVRFHRSPTDCGWDGPGIVNGKLRS